eukprot:CAMPEP_0113852410 /NCGR_PEP_ID=MMETSP0372-20130328/5478_1 /TAXON_ID=340204 /ORGANISM="Lankesteria abbotti" /LENGTH=86 /DNA_ID=CAMNT_0000823923 /DNA_START=281 /DNA_END=537 /DNA_ORIENTATION=- /assembly_acc=CAM_ASM_000359
MHQQRQPSRSRRRKHQSHANPQGAALDESLELAEINAAQLKEMLRSHGPTDGDTRNVYNSCNREIAKLETEATKSPVGSDRQKRIR